MFNEQPSTKLDFTPRCHCCPSTPYCSLFGNQEQWLFDNFGCGYSKLLFEFFQYEPEHADPFFRMLIRFPMQLKPLKLKDKALELKLLQYHEKCNKLNKKLGKMMDAAMTPASVHFNGIRKVL